MSETANTPEASEVERLTKVIEKAKEWVLANYPPEQYEQDTDIENLWIALDESEKAIASMNKPAVVDEVEVLMKVRGCIDCNIKPMEREEIARDIIETIRPYLRDTKPVSGWQLITFDEKGQIGNTPAHEQEVIFIYGNRMIVGIFLNDIRKSHYPDGEEYDGDYGFYDDDENFYETEGVSFWMPKLATPKQEQGNV